MLNEFAEASRLKVRFQTTNGKPAGELTTEDLWTLPLETLDAMAQKAAAEIEKAPKATLLRKAGANAEPKTVVENRLRYEVIAYIMNVRQDEQEAAAQKALERSIAANDKELAAAALARLQEKKYEGKSEEELLAILKK